MVHSTGSTSTKYRLATNDHVWFAVNMPEQRFIVVNATQNTEEVLETLEKSDSGGSTNSVQMRIVFGFNSDSKVEIVADDCSLA